MEELRVEIRVGEYEWNRMAGRKRRGGRKKGLEVRNERGTL